MSNAKWIETKREYDVSSSGDKTLKKITLELNNTRLKDKIELFLKTFALIAIFIPIVIFLLQQRDEYKKRKKIFEIETFSSTASCIQTILDKDMNDAACIKAREELNYNIYPRLRIFGNKKAIDLFDTIKLCLSYYLAFKDTYKGLDTFSRYSIVVAFDPFFDSETPKEKRKIRDSINNFEWTEWKYEVFNRIERCNNLFESKDSLYFNVWLKEHCKYTNKIASAMLASWTRGVEAHRGKQQIQIRDADANLASWTLLKEQFKSLEEYTNRLINDLYPLLINGISMK